MGARRGMTGLEIAIILVAFVITAAAFNFMLLNMGFLTSQKNQTVISSSLEESTTTLQVVDAVVGSFALSDSQVFTNMTNVEFFLRLPSGGEVIDLSSDNLTVTYTNLRCHGVIYPPNGTVVTIMCLNGDADHLLEQGEIFEVEINLTALTGTMVTPITASAWDMYPHPYEWWQVTLKPTTGSTVTIRRTLGAINRVVEPLY
jgi:archaeal flagellin FlaB